MRISDWSSDVCSSDLVKASASSDGSRSSNSSSGNIGAGSAVVPALTVWAEAVEIMDKARRQKTTKRPVLAMLDCIRPRHPHCPPARRYRLYTLSSSARSEEHTSEHQSLMRPSYAVFC